MNVIVDGEFVPIEDLGGRLREWRMAKGVRRGLLTRFFHVSSPGYYFWERGVTRPSPEFWPRIVEVLEGRVELGKKAGRDVATNLDGQGE